MSIGYDDTGYEIYDSEKIKKKRAFVLKPLHFNKTNITFLIIIFTVIFLLYDYCSNNFDIDLQEEYKDYKDSDLMFGKKNLCQYARDKYIYDILAFKKDDNTISIIAYVILSILLIILLYFTGILERIGVYIIDTLSSAFTLDKVLYGTNLFTHVGNLFRCSDEFFISLFRRIF